MDPDDVENDPGEEFEPPWGDKPEVIPDAFTRVQAKKFVEEARARSDKLARERHGNKRLNQSRQLEEIAKEEK